MAKDSLRFLNLDNEPTPVNYTCDILDKSASTFNYIQYMFDRTNRMFKYNNLPETIPDFMLEYMLQIYGSVAIISVNDSLYAMRANFGGPPDPYYRPTQAVIANPALNIQYMYRIINNFPPFDKETWDAMQPCVRMLNDTQIQGLLPLFSRYATQMSENDVSIRSAQINLRQQTIIAADTGVEIDSANAYIANLEAGKLSSIQKRPFMEGIQITPAVTGNSNVVMQLIELQQYLKASWYNEIGLNSNFNMKRQYVSSEEINSTADIMLPLVDNMYQCRVEAIEAINKEFGTDISVEKDSAWANKQLQADMSVSINPTTGEPVVTNGTEEIEVSDSSSTVDETMSEETVDNTPDATSENTSDSTENETPPSKVDDTEPTSDSTDDNTSDTTEDGESNSTIDDTQEEPCETPVVVNINISGDVENIEVTSDESTVDDTESEVSEDESVQDDGDEDRTD